MKWGTLKQWHWISWQSFPHTLCMMLYCNFILLRDIIVKLCLIATGSNQSNHEDVLYSIEDIGWNLITKKPLLSLFSFETLSTCCVKRLWSEGEKNDGWFKFVLISVSENLLVNATHNWAAHLYKHGVDQIINFYNGLDCEMSPIQWLVRLSVFKVFRYTCTLLKAVVIIKY